MTTQPELTARRRVADGMAEAARAWLACLDSEQRAVACGSVPMDADSDAERRRWFYTPTDHGGLTLNQQRPAQQRAAMRLVAVGAVHRRVRHGCPDHGPGERPGPRRGFRRGLRPGPRPGPGNVLPEGLRRTGRTPAVGMAVRRPSRLAQLPHRRQPARLGHALLHRRGPGVLAPARRARASSARPGGGPGTRTCQLSSRPTGGARRSPAEGPARPRHGQPQPRFRGRPGDPADRDLAR